MINLKLIIVFTLLLTSFLLNSCSTSESSTDGVMNDVNTANQTDTNITTSVEDSLTTAQKYSLAYMWNEERLAYDIYQNLYAVTGVKQLKNISENSEAVHISLVQDIIELYDINITNLVDYTQHYSLAELEAMPSGVYGIQAIQDLYDTLYAEGISSSAASLEVGCKVEVVDVNDLDEYIIEAGTNKALVDTFTILRDGSYTHYWAFDAGLKNLGVTDGCCSLDAEFCKTEEMYPKN